VEKEEFYIRHFEIVILQFIFNATPGETNYTEVKKIFAERRRKVSNRLRSQWHCAWGLNNNFTNDIFIVILLTPKCFKF